MQRDVLCVCVGAGLVLVSKQIYSLIKNSSRSNVAQKQLSTADHAPKQLSTADYALKMKTGMVGAMDLAMITVGNRLGLYGTMKAKEWWTAGELAAAASLDERFLLEWLCQQAATHILSFNRDHMAFSLPPAAYPILANPGTLKFMAPYAEAITNCFLRLPAAVKGFQTGIGSDYNLEAENLAGAMAQMHMPELTECLIPNAFPLVMEGRFLQRLQEGIVVADIGCSRGDLTFELARRFPKSTFHAYEVAKRPLELARRTIKERKLKNVLVHDAAIEPLSMGPKVCKQNPGKFDACVTFDVVHDMTDPSALMREVRQVLSPEGCWFIADLATFNSLPDRIEHHPNGAAYFGISVCVCLSAGLSEKGGAGLGTLGLSVETATEMLREAGFSSVKDFTVEPLTKSQLFEVRI